jgi:hypothetical protein
VSTHDRERQSDVDIYIHRGDRNMEGMAIITSEPRELTIVNIVGSIDLSKLAQLQGKLGAPKMNVPGSNAPASPPGAAQVPH